MGFAGGFVVGSFEDELVGIYYGFVGCVGFNILYRWFLGCARLGQHSVVGWFFGLSLNSGFWVMSSFVCRQ